jgi:hypothetical protein
MTDDSTQRWPDFEMVTFSTPTGIPHGWDAELVSKGVPKSLLRRYTATSTLALLEVPDYGPLVSFGTTMLQNRVCLDPHTRAVVEITYVPTDTINLRASVVGLPGHVNASLDQFIACVHAVLDRFPFDSGHPVEDHEWEDREQAWAHVDQRFQEWDRAVRDMTETLRRIDTTAVADADTFWRTFLDDVQMGDFATEDILGHLDE